ncbi:EamA family transporter RarD [Pseudoduganella violaceinigra]|uniref:EamA family transporter RarD n=1 Tax=Pseudoduganella violaceinigra TaxID=246602 RepID=UPI000421AF41|nr:EamA family transporter RarD [Pseudoduganella violaceinigra]
MNTGMLYAAGAFLSWGLFPLYFHAIKNVPASEILAHRMAWSLVFLMLVLTVRRQWKWLPDVLRKPKVVASFLASAFLLSANWFVYIWAVNNGHVVDASLGYFINPLVNVLLGMLVLKEKLRRGQWLAIGVAATGVAWLTWQAGQVPYIALVLALSFGAYGLLRKTAALAALEGLSFETLILFPLAVAYLGWLVVHGQSVFLNAESDSTRWLLAAAGPTTAIPLLLFAAGARRIPMSVLGMLQYMSPSLQMLLGVWVFHEAFSSTRLAGFLFIWSALLIYMLEGWLISRKTT